MVHYILLVLGSGLIIGAFILYRKTVKFIQNAIKTEGSVISQTYSSGANNSTTYTPRIAFKTRKGSLIEFESHMGSRVAYSMGATMEVLYQEDAPDKARVNRYLTLWGFPTLLSIVGVFCCIAGYALLTES